ncbi:CYTH-like domain-containing protein [Xylaria longipes]|nr:CYTH-like domain-containing protein [Xylaria longipes]
MDLRAMLNAEGGGAGGDRAKAAHPPPPLPPPGQTISTSAAVAVPGPPTPGTPIQTGPPLPPHSFRDYSHSTHASPVSQPREYPPPGHPNHNPASAGPGSAPYASPTSYHHPSPGGPFSGRPSVPPLQPLAPHDLRSPGSVSLSGPSPYRHTPTSSASVGSTGYPFPPTQQPPASPIQRHQYGPPNYSRDSYSSQPAVGSHGSISYPQGQQQQHQQQPPPPPPPPPLQHQQQPIPQTPPVGTPGGSHQYLHQRSLSIHSTPTPTSTHSQHPPYPPSYTQGSPVATHHPPPAHLDQQHHRHQSPQPATPRGPHMTAPPRQSPAASYQQQQQQPPSPYQQRMPSTSMPYQQMMKTSPPPPPPASIPRMPNSGHSAYDAVSESQRRSQSQQSRSERERSISVSPKTRVPSLPSSTGQPASNEQQDPFHSQQRLQPHPPPGSVATMEPQRDVTPAKRKIDDRDLRPDEVENQRQPPPPPKMNGNHALPPQPQPSSTSSTSPTMSRNKRTVHNGPPAWAQAGRKRTPAASRNFSIKQHRPNTPSAAGPVNGAQRESGPTSRTEHASRHTSPETARSTTQTRDEPSQVAVKDSLTFGGQPFPWEPSIEASKPIDVISRSVADFFVFNVLQGPNPTELRARGAQIEIEAKLGTIIDKSTNDRVELRIQAGECVIGEGARIAFRSSMTENQHRELNEYLNNQVKASLFPRNSTAAPRVPVQYVHRRQKDRFFELPAHLRQRLPHSIANLLPPNAPLKARVTYDQKTGNVLAKIVKARVADLHIHMAHMPLDCRISINIEWDWDGPPQEIEENQIPNKDRQPDRNKDRLSYTHGFYQIDLTQVTQEAHGPHGQAGLSSKEHELEIELESRVLYEHGHLLMRGEPNRFTDLVDGFVDNVRVLAKRCPQPTM